MRKAVIAVILVALAGAGYTLYRLTRTLPVLTVTTWAGSPAYVRAQLIALMQPYGEAADVNVHLALYNGGLDDLRRAVATRSFSGDVIDFELPEVIQACQEGLLEKIDASALPPGADGTPAGADFVRGAIGPCWIGTVIYSQAIIAVPGSAASSLADFFDLRKFPGGRGLHTGPKYNLEMALLADGVAPNDVYPTLLTDAGFARALTKLDSIRPAIVWWSATSEPMNLLNSGRAALSTILIGDIYDAAIHHEPSVKAIWDRELYEFDVFAVPKGDPKKDMAMDFIRFASGSKPLGTVAEWVPYGPARRSALALVGDNPDLHIAMKPFLPSAPQNFQTAFAINDSWWLAHDAQIEARWQAWLAKN